MLNHIVDYFNEQKVDSIIITKPLVELGGEKLGFLLVILTKDRTFYDVNLL